MELTRSFSRIAADPKSWEEFKQLPAKEKRLLQSGFVEIADFLRSSESAEVFMEKEGQKYFIVNYINDREDKEVFIGKVSNGPGRNQRLIKLKDLAGFLMKFDPHFIWEKIFGNNGKLLYRKVSNIKRV